MGAEPEPLARPRVCAAELVVDMIGTGNEVIRFFKITSVVGEYGKKGVSLR